MKVRRLFILIAAVFLFTAGNAGVFAGGLTSGYVVEYTSSGYTQDDALAYHRIVFVIDVSGSMNTEDPNRIRNELAKMFVDSLYSPRTQVGFVAFNNTITHSHPLTSIASQGARDSIKTEIEQLVTAGWTDIGIGLNYGVHMLVDALSASGNPASQQSSAATHSSIIFLSDGERTNRAAPGRTMEDAWADEQEAIEMAVRYGIPIHAVSISVGGFDLTYMNNIANDTGGNWYEINRVSELPDLFERIFADITGITPVRHIITGTGSQQNIDILIPHHHTTESNIVIWHNRALQDAQIQNIQTQDSGNSVVSYTLPYQSRIGEITHHQSRRFSSIKITNPLADNMEANLHLNLNITANYGAEISLLTINHHNAFPAIETPQNLSLLNVPVEARLYRLNSDIPLTAERYYIGMAAELVATDMRTGRVAVFPMENTGTSFTAIYENISPGYIVLQVNVTSVNYNASSIALPITFTNTPPIIHEPIVPAEVLRRNSYLTLDLNDFAYDADGDILTFEIHREISGEVREGAGGEISGATHEGISEEAYGEMQGAVSGAASDRISLDGSILTIDLRERGSDNFQLHALDGRGGIATHQVIFEVVPWWIYFRMAFLIILIIFFILLSGYVIFSRRLRRIPAAAKPVPLSPSTYRFSDARFEGYFLNTLSGNEIPILHWSASYIENKHTISLGEMFNMLDVEEKLPEAHKIFFEAGNNHTVIFHHATECTITLGNKDVPRGKREVLNFDNKLYIIFEDHSTEIEVRYKRMKRRSSAGTYIR